MRKFVAFGWSVLVLCLAISAASLLGIIPVSKAQVPLGRIVVYSTQFTPVATAAAIQTVEQNLTVTGAAFQPSDYVYLNGPAPTSLCPPTTIRVSAANTVAIGFTTLTAAACTPAAGTYNIIAIR